MWEKFKEKGYRDSWLDSAEDKLKAIQREQLYRFALYVVHVECCMLVKHQEN